MQNNIESPEFWEQVKKEFLAKECRNFCAASDEFKKLWWDATTENMILGFANDFLESNTAYKMFSVGVTNLFYSQSLERDNGLYRLVRLRFLDYMINRTRNEK